MLRYSMVTLLVVVSLLALFSAGFANPTMIFSRVIVSLTLFSLASCMIVAAVSRSRRPFALGFALAGWTYHIFTNSIFTLQESEFLVTEWAVDEFAEALHPDLEDIEPYPMGLGVGLSLDEPDAKKLRFSRIGHSFFVFIFATIGGLAACCLQRPSPPPPTPKPPMTNPNPTARRRFRFSLRTLMAVVVLLSVGLGWFGWKLREAEPQWRVQASVRSQASKGAAERVCIQRLCEELDEHPDARFFRIHCRLKSGGWHSLLYCRREKRIGYESDVGSGYSESWSDVDETAIHDVANKEGTLTDFGEPTYPIHVTLPPTPKTNHDQP